MFLVGDDLLSRSFGFSRDAEERDYFVYLGCKLQSMRGGVSVLVRRYGARTAQGLGNLPGLHAWGGLVYPPTKTGGKATALPVQASRSPGMQTRA